MDENTMSDYDCTGKWDWDPFCPGGAYRQLYSHYSSWWNWPDLMLVQFELQDNNMRKTLYNLDSTNEGTDTWSYTTYGVTAQLQDAMRGFYARSLQSLSAESPFTPPQPLHLSWSNQQRFEVETKAPFVRVSCVGVQGELSSLNQTTNVNFTILPEFSTAASPSYKYTEVDITAAMQEFFSKRGINTLDNQTAPILSIPISLGDNGAASLGLVILRQENHSNPFSLATCSIDARWADAHSIIRSQDGNVPLEHEYAANRVRTLVETEITSAPPSKIWLDSFEPPNDGSLQPIQLMPGWYDLLATLIPESYIPAGRPTGYAANRTTLESLLELILLPEHGGPLSNFSYDINSTTETEAVTKGMESLISLYIADGLSRHANHFNLDASHLLVTSPTNGMDTSNITLVRTIVRQGEPIESFSRPAMLSADNSTRFVMRAYYTGYVITAQDWFDYLSLAILLLHALMALVHTVWIVYYARTSDAWDTITEFISLAQASPVPEEGLLDNTCAGIRTFKTMGRTMWVEVAGEDATGEELRLRLGEKQEITRDERLQIGVEKEYGMTKKV
jgi:hypothetical protein